MELHYLKLFNTLATELSFSKTANLLYISQPAVSIQIKKLEEELGFKLFNRSGKNLHLTGNGKLLYEYTKKIFLIVDEAETVFTNKSGNIKGFVEIAASNTPGSYILPRILGEFKYAYPDVVANLHISNTYEVEKLALENRVDFAVNGGEMDYSSYLVVEKLSGENVIIVASPSDKLAQYEYINKCKDLEHTKFIAHGKNSNLYALVESIIDDLDIPVDIHMTLGHIDAIKQAVLAGIGISAMPASTVKMELELGLLKQLKVMNKRWVYPYNLIHHKRRQLSPAAKKLMELVTDRMKALN
jgi:DNA-binding transcriptional LysR family regulator